MPIPSSHQSPGVQPSVTPLSSQPAESTTSSGGGIPSADMIACLANDMFSAQHGGWAPGPGSSTPGRRTALPASPQIPGSTVALGEAASPSFGFPTGDELRTILAHGASSPSAATSPAALGVSGSSFYFLPEAPSFPQSSVAPAAPSTSYRPQLGGHPVASPGAFDISAIRRDFPILGERVNGRPLIWLDNAATTQKPQAVIDRLAYFYQHENSNIHRAAHELAARSTDAYEAAREKVARFLGASSSSEIVFVRGATEAINLVAQSWGRQNVGKDDEIVITWLEHHANIVPWQQLCSEKGARLRVAPVDDSGQVRLDEYQKLFSSRTKIAAFPVVSNALGTVTPARQMVEIARRYGAQVLVDGAQSVSHLRTDVKSLDCDWFVLSGHKIFAPTGIGVLYGKQDVLDATLPWQGGGNMIQCVTFEKTVYQPAPARFEAGTGNIADAVGLGAAVDYLQQVGIENISRYEHDLLVYATDALKGVPGLRPIGTAAEKAAVLSFVLDGFRSEDVGKALEPRRHRRPRRPPLRSANSRTLWGRQHRPPVACPLQHLCGNRRPRRGAAAHPKWTVRPPPLTARIPPSNKRARRGICRATP